jgi:excisionase family DNA binding protein
MNIYLQKLAAAGKSDFFRPELAAAGKLAFRVDEACQALGIGRTSLYLLAKTGKLRIIKIAGRTLVPLSELERLTSLDHGA